MKQLKQTITHIQSLPRAFWVIIIATLMNQIGNMAFVFLVVYLTSHLHFSLTNASLIFAAFGISMIITGLISGFLIDQVGAARVLITSLIANGIVLLIFPYVDHYLTIMIMGLLWGFAYGLYRPASQTLVSHLSTVGLHKITFSVYRLAINLGMSIGPAIGGYLASYSYPSIFYINGVTNLLASIILVIGFWSTQLLRFQPQENGSFDIRNWLNFDKRLYFFLLGMICVSMIFFQHESTLAVFIHTNLGLPLSFYGWLFTINTLMIVFLELPLNVVTLNWSYRLVFILGSLFITLGFAGFVFSSQQWTIVFLTILWTIGEMILYPGANSYIADIAPPAHRGKYMALFSTSSNLGMFLGPWTGGMIMQYYGAPALWISCGLWGLVAIGLFSFLHEFRQYRTSIEQTVIQQ